MRVTVSSFSLPSIFEGSFSSAANIKVSNVVKYSRRASSCVIKQQLRRNVWKLMRSLLVKILPETPYFLRELTQFRGVLDVKRRILLT